MPTKEEVKKIAEKCGMILIEFVNTQEISLACNFLHDKALNDFGFHLKGDKEWSPELREIQPILIKIFQELDEGWNIGSIRRTKKILKIHADYHKKLAVRAKKYLAAEESFFDGSRPYLYAEDFLAYCFVNFFKSDFSRNRIFVCNWCGKFFIANQLDDLKLEWDDDDLDYELEKDIRLREYEYKFCPNYTQDGPLDKCKNDFHNALKNRKVKDCIGLYYYNKRKEDM